MKTRLASIIFIICITVISLTAQTTGVYFNSPQDGQTYSTPDDKSTVSIYFAYSVNLSEPRGEWIGSYVKLIKDDGTIQSTLGGGTIDNRHQVSPGTHTWYLELHEQNVGGYWHHTATTSVTFTAKFQVSVNNNFGQGVSTVYIDGSAKVSGSSAVKAPGQPVGIGAVNQAYNNEYYLWNSSGVNDSKWVNTQKDDVQYNIPGGSSTNYTIGNNDSGAKLTAHMRKRLNVTFSNQFVGVIEDGDIKINGNTVTGGTTTQVVEQNPVTGGAITQTIDHIVYSFEEWVDASTGATVSTNSNYTFNPQDHKSLVAKFVGRPSLKGRNMHFSTTRFQPITIYWSEHQNSNVTQYEIWRQVNGGTPTQIGTVNRGTTQFTDNDFMYTGSVADENLRYDVRAYYSVEDTRSLAAWGTVFGEWMPKANGNDEDALALNEVPTEFGIDNYPNPFNPSTSISFAVPEAGTYTLRVFNMLGQEVATLFNNQVSAGKYQVEFDASKLSSGIYIYNLSGSNVNISKKMMLMK